MNLLSFTKFYHFSCLFLVVVFGNSINAFADTEYTVGGTYRFHGQNTLGNNPTLDFGFSVNGSMLMDETHEVGFNFDYSINWEELTNDSRISEISTLSPQVFYRYHFLLTGAEDRFPIMGYFGSHIGGVKMVSPDGSSHFDFLMGFAGGFNLFLAEDVAIDVLLLKYSNVFQRSNRSLFDQGLGVKFFF